MAIIRLATPADAEGILEIYVPHIKNTSFTFETKIPSTDEFAVRIQTYLQNWPWLVCESGNKITGYAYGAKYRERSGYQWCVESSVYIHDDYQRKGIAYTLYTALIKILKKQGYNNVYAVINLPNEKSVAFHEKMGFEYFAIYKNVGYKLGKWKNVGWWQLNINEYIPGPEPPIRFSEINKDFLEEIFKSIEI
jgi:L-amino acid N-acyltransferase YncA